MQEQQHTAMKPYIGVSAPKRVLEVNFKLKEETASSFRLAYMGAKERLAFEKLCALLKLQELSGAKVGFVQKSD